MMTRRRDHLIYRLGSRQLAGLYVARALSRRSRQRQRLRRRDAAGHGTENGRHTAADQHPTADRAPRRHLPTPSPSPTPSPTPMPPTEPLLLARQPERGEELQVDAPLVLTFDQAMDKASVKGAFAIEPAGRRAPGMERRAHGLV